ncbi:MAG: sulfotransferase [Spirochaetes bacterium]|nr:sulfotransferase [Spirochaetota bacterium]
MEKKITKIIKKNNIDNTNYENFNVDNKPKIKLICSAGSTFTNWINILFKIKFKIEFKFIPRAILTTFATFFLMPFVILEKIIYDKKIKKIHVKSPIFIIGHMRSGTTFLHYLLSQDKRFCYLTTAETIFPSIFILLNKLINKFMNFVLPLKRPMDNMKLNNNLPQEDEFAIANICPYSPNIGAYFPKNIDQYYYDYSFFNNVKSKIIDKWKKVYKYILQKTIYYNNGKRMLSKNLINANRILLLKEMFPDAKFIFIYRNPYSVYLSTKKLYKKFIFQNMSFQSITDKELEEKILNFAKAGFKKYFQDRKKIKKENLIEIRYEDFVKKPIYHIKRIYNKLKITNFDKVKEQFVQFAKSYENYKPEKYSIDNKLKNKIYNELKFIFDEFGYEK